MSHVSKIPYKMFSASGCGDCFAAGIIYGILNNLNEEDCVSLGLKAADLSLKSHEAVPSTLSSLNENNSKLSTYV